MADFSSGGSGEDDFITKPSISTEDKRSIIFSSYYGYKSISTLVVVTLIMTLLNFAMIFLVVKAIINRNERRRKYLRQCRLRSLMEERARYAAHNGPLSIFETTDKKFGRRKDKKIDKNYVKA